MSEYKNTVTNLLTALFGEPPVNYQGGSPKRAVNALRKYCDAIFVPAHMSTVKNAAEVYCQAKNRGNPW